MKTLILALSLWLLAPAAFAVTLEPAPIILRAAAPGYLKLDGRWYVYEAPFGQANPGIMQTYAQPTRGGFFAHGFLSSRNCQRSGGGAMSTNFTLEHGESIQSAAAGAIPIARSNITGQLRAKIALVSCPGNVVVMMIDSAHGDLVCSSAIANPFGPGICRAAEGSEAIFASGFEAP